ncbi:cytochrome b/b6 domain-containing protein [Shewanella aestuarii]|uniref:Cytochrome b/b6 domain-containing protein n=1 Tax=Shewanella aestuarii TaxID=1028752 RepID=A0A6G9QGP2_9GAMM|nr:cytochrome b/b6 domain-containing protein [Shewanella aestuarii]QIR13714.1 cytochrome b/b6 domain-containing protein [Shewanella aestuarii]
MGLKQVGQAISSFLHALVLLFCVTLVCTSPWIVIGRQLRTNASFWDQFHVYGGLFTALLAMLFTLKVCAKGQWRLFFPWLIFDFSQLISDIKGLAKGRLPVSGGKGLISIIEGLGVILLLLVCVTGLVWFLVAPSDAITWRDYHKVFAQGFIGFLVLHALLALLHIRDFFD